MRRAELIQNAEAWKRFRKAVRDAYDALRQVDHGTPEGLIGRRLGKLIDKAAAVSAFYDDEAEESDE